MPAHTINPEQAQYTQLIQSLSHTYTHTCTHTHTPPTHTQIHTHTCTHAGCLEPNQGHWLAVISGVIVGRSPRKCCAMPGNDAALCCLPVQQYCLLLISVFLCVHERVCVCVC